MSIVPGMKNFSLFRDVVLKLESGVYSNSLSSLHTSGLTVSPLQSVKKQIGCYCKIKLITQEEQ